MSKIIRIADEDYDEIQLLIEKELLSKTSSLKPGKEYNDFIMDIASHKVWFSTGKMIHKLIDYYKKPKKPVTA